MQAVIQSSAESDFAALRVTMVDRQVRTSDVTSYPIIAAMLAIPREDFVPDALRDVAYVGADLPLAPARTMPEARTLAKMIDGLAIAPDDRALVIGAGLGYGAALVARMAGQVIALEELPHLAAGAAAALARHKSDARIVQGKLVEGAPEAGPYDVILIEGGVRAIPPVIAAQLAEGGRIVALFVEGGLGLVRIGTKVAGQIHWRLAFNALLPVLPGFTTTDTFAL
ncbi:protein-L-isoaspartate O-methyltransferase family protein [Ketogulonicigenium vulgare]|uniref:Protein-L-isoaspartate O-methyltransferase n=1 Tax=Ketogulonicigenium vulgare (strain WSH-001) TaxID=759362 RepID=F9Y873_KETVW|nr:protein-L-isoaspartate O-methyltransferase [Ketogulonicigenium vulgare]ADO41509.1 Protein-L-isoaspartate carboxylmethyltransferase [Ketogulonicigenium vulgare Y25]AEM42359.1 Protein-L-isoaspartate O-methyltransferase, putative [Ketogulonicigenium vulgare WSH-001]ALJ79983.1 protein-L-isoaspartate O-methyltransferase [Ketogulonicigenium vulgare]ANW32873.1 protein-L-isoaspartate O-methyltransferase [Ketogulonicigenium vulgare]AOZ53443.1 Protein-L-isoaspartate carboxylmethyltransferase [Ketogul